MENKYASVRLIDGKPRKVIVDKNGDIINKNPSKEELENLKEEPYKKYTKYDDREYLLKCLRQFYEETGKVPTQRDFIGDPRYSSFEVYRSRFGSWNNALKLSGLYINRFADITNEELLEYLKWFYKENGRSPAENDFNKDHRYPGYRVYFTRFGSWNKALKLAGLDVDSMIKKGVMLYNEYYKSRWFEIQVKNLFPDGSIDLSGENQNSFCDGICPKGHIYDVKSSKLYDDKCYIFSTKNKFREEIEYYYLGGFSSDWSRLEYSWRVPGEIVERDHFIVNLMSGRFNIGNMEEYEITEKFVFRK